MTNYIAGFLFLALWLYLLWATEKAGLRFWHFLTGSAGLFILLMIGVRPFVMEPLGRVVAAAAGAIGRMTHTFEAYLKYGVLFINSGAGSITLHDLECSGIIEIIAYLSILVFFRVYTKRERLLAGIFGTVYIILANVIRLIVICLTIYFGGVRMYYMAHSLIGRIIFYFLTVLLYFYVFTKPHIVRIKVGRFRYDAS